MRVSNNNDRLYDVRNFDSYSNVYAIKINQPKIDDYYQYVIDFLNKCFITYKFETLILSFGNKNDVKNCQGAYRIIYGHFYNDQDFFIYHDLYNGKIITHTIKKTNKDNLYFNVNNILLCSSTFNNINNQFKILNDLLKKNGISNGGQTKITLNYKYNPDNYELKIDSGNLINNVNYLNNCLIINFNQNKCITKK